MLHRFDNIEGLDLEKFLGIYSESIRENAEEFFPDEETASAVKKEEEKFKEFLEEFFSKPGNEYWILEEDGVWTSALRTSLIYEGFYYLEALETRPDSRRRGCAKKLLGEVQDELRKLGAFRICDCVYKKNDPSVQTHLRAGFRIVSDEGCDYLSGTSSEYNYGFEYKFEGEKKSGDISYVSGDEKFNYRVCGIIVSENRILALRDERSPYYYLPGGRVRMGETAEEAIKREIREELLTEPEIIRPLWLSQSFFTEDVDGLKYHELCVYFLLEVSSQLVSSGESFTLHEGVHTHEFEWLEFERLKDEYFYPLFLKTEIFRLPEHFTIRTDIE